MVLPITAFGQVATQKVVNTAVIYSANSPVTFNALTTFNGNFTGIGADYLLPNQTLTANGSIITRVLGDARYSAFGAVTTNSNTFADSSSQSFYDVLVRHNLRVNVSAVFNSNALVNAGNLTITNMNHAKLVIVESDPSLVSNTGAGIELYSPVFLNGTMFKAAYSTNSVVPGSLPGDMVLRAEPNHRIIFSDGTTIRALFDNTSATKSFVLTNSTDLTISGGNLSLTAGNISGLGSNNTLNNQTLTGDGSILTRGTADARYDARYTQGWAWYLASAAGTSQGNGQRATITYGDFGAGGAAAVQFDAENGRSTFYSLPDTVAGKSVIVKTIFGTRAAETNAASAAVSVHHFITYVTNLATMTETVANSGDDPQGSSAVIVPVAVSQSQRYYEGITTNTVPSTARFINVQTFRAGNDAGDTMTTNAYWIGLKVSVIP